MNHAALIEAALDEDLHNGDLTTFSTIPNDTVSEAYIVSKEPLVVSGHDIGKAAFEGTARRIGGHVTYDILENDGTHVADRTKIAHVRGHLRTILIGERLALNFMMRMCGIATNVQAYSKAAQGKLRVVDTRKTTPLMRVLEKAAVRHGGGHNHRFGLYDGVMIKDNHIAGVGGDVALAVKRAREAVHHLVKIEVEVTHIEQIRPAIDAGADVLLLDNMDDPTLQAAIAEARGIDSRVILEASGNINPARLARIRDFGLDVASAGGLIHQARWADLSLQVAGTR